MPFLNYNDNNFSNCIKEFEKIAESLKIEVLDDEVWQIARESEEIPHIENIYQSILLSRIINHFEEDERIEINSYINGMDTHLYFNEDGGWNKICSLEEFEKEVLRVTNR